MNDAPEPLIPAPRHLRRRKFRPAIPDTSFLSRQKAAELARRQQSRVQQRGPAKVSKEQSWRRKRAVALALLVLLILSIIALLLSLVLVR